MGGRVSKPLNLQNLSYHREVQALLGKSGQVALGSTDSPDPLFSVAELCLSSLLVGREFILWREIKETRLHHKPEKQDIND